MRSGSTLLSLPGKWSGISSSSAWRVWAQIPCSSQAAWKGLSVISWVMPTAHYSLGTGVGSQEWKHCLSARATEQKNELLCEVLSSPGQEIIKQSRRSLSEIQCGGFTNSEGLDKQTVKDPSWEGV